MTRRAFEKLSGSFVLFINTLNIKSSLLSRVNTGTRSFQWGDEFHIQSGSRNQISEKIYRLDHTDKIIVVQFICEGKGGIEENMAHGLGLMRREEQDNFSGCFFYKRGLKDVHLYL